MGIFSQLKLNMKARNWRWKPHKEHYESSEQMRLIVAVITSSLPHLHPRALRLFSKQITKSLHTFLSWKQNSDVKAESKTSLYRYPDNNRAETECVITVLSFVMIIMHSFTLYSFLYSFFFMNSFASSGIKKQEGKSADSFKDFDIIYFKLPAIKVIFKHQNIYCTSKCVRFDKAAGTCINWKKKALTQEMGTIITIWTGICVYIFRQERDRQTE